MSPAKEPGLICSATRSFSADANRHAVLAGICKKRALRCSGSTVAASSVSPRRAPAAGMTTSKFARAEASGGCRAGLSGADHGGRRGGVVAGTAEKGAFTVLIASNAYSAV